MVKSAATSANVRLRNHSALIVITALSARKVEGTCAGTVELIKALLAENDDS